MISLLWILANQWFNFIAAWARVAIYILLSVLFGKIECFRLSLQLNWIIGARAWENLFHLMKFSIFANTKFINLLHCHFCSSKQALIFRVVCNRAREINLFLILMPSTDGIWSAALLVIYIVTTWACLRIHFPSFVLSRLLPYSTLISNYITEDYFLYVFLKSTSYAPGPGILFLHAIYFG